MIGLIMWIIALAGASYMAAKGIMDAEDYEVEHEDFDYHYSDDEEESITILRHYPDGTVEVDEL